MNNREIIHNYVTGVTMPSNKKVKVTCTKIATGKQVYKAISEQFSAYTEYLDKTKSGINYKDFTLKYSAKWAAEEMFNNIKAILSNTKLKVEEPVVEEPVVEDPVIKDPVIKDPVIGGGTVAEDPAGMSTNTIIIIAVSAVLVLAVVLLLLKKKLKH